MSFGITTSNKVFADCEHPPHVTDIYPSGDLLPENTLRFYIYFSTPMKFDGNINSIIYLIDSQGEKIKGAFLENKFNLWSSDYKRLTIIFDPGRIKTGLLVNKYYGRALHVDQNYQLVIDSSIVNDYGCRLHKIHKKFFKTKQAIDRPIAPKHWKLQIPNINTQESLSIIFDRAYDHLSLAYRLRIKTKEGKIVPGKITLSNAEKKWLFQPRDPWQSGKYSIDIDQRLEDLAGNRISGEFDRDINQENLAPSMPVSIDFHLK